MKAIIFIQKLKQTVLEIESNGSEHFFFVETDYKLIRDLKDHAFRKLKSIEKGNIKSDLSSFLQDLLSRDIFISRIRYCIVKLKEFSIPEKDFKDYICKALSWFLEGKSTDFFRARDLTVIDDTLVLELAKCFQPWYRPEDIFLIDFAQERQLILVNFEEKRWYRSNLGDYLLQLPNFEAISFLCSLEVLLTLEYHKNKFISKSLLTELLEKGISQRFYPYSLLLFGIVSNEYDRTELKVTEFGHRVLSYIDNNLEKFKDAILFMLASEAIGFKSFDEVDFDEIFRIIRRSPVLIDDQKKSLQRSLELYRTGNFIDSIRILYPVLEGTLDTGIQHLGLKPANFAGMKPKVKKLETERLISNKMSTGLEIFNGRNKLLHGNILEDDAETIRPLYSLVLGYLKRLITEMEQTLKVNPNQSVAG